MFGVFDLRQGPISAISGLVALAVQMVPLSKAFGDPPLPTFGSTVYKVTVANSSINGGVPASTASADNATAINAYITYCNAHGGGTVEIPAGTFLSSQLNMKSNVNLQIDSGSILRDTSVSNTLIKCSSGSNMQISGSGIIDGAATKTAGSANLVDMRGVTTLAILGVSIQNAGHEHLVPINDNNLTISGVTISDPGTLAANSGNYLANTDAIDYAGNNVLIKNCNINCGDDDIVAKPASNACTNITITGCTIGAGHGISVGGGIAAGVSNMLVTNCTFNGTTYGLRIKAHDASDPDTTSDGNNGGGTAHPLKNVIYKNITMTNVGTAIAIESFYDGGDTFATSPTDLNSYTYNLATPAAVSPTTPMYQNIAFENITATGSNYSVRIDGLNTTPNSLNGVSFSNVNISASKHTELWYGTNIDVSGLNITVPGSDAFANASPVKGAYLSNLTNLSSLATGPALFPGDFNRDGQVTVADISAMMSAMTNLSGFESSHGLSDPQMQVIGDVNDDFKINNADVQALIDLIANGGGSAGALPIAVPEPSSLLLAVVGLGALAPFARRKLANS
jgi:polygalacturonase